MSDAFYEYENLGQIITDFTNFRADWITDHPEALEEDDIMLHSIDNLLEELKAIKNEKEYPISKKIKIIALLTWVGGLIEENGFDDDFDDDDFFDFFEDEEGEESCDFEEVLVLPQKGEKKETKTKKPAKESKPAPKKKSDKK